MLHFAVILDRSGSMQARKDDHEGGLRSFVENQKRLPDEMQFTFMQFDNVNPCEVVIDGKPLRDVQPETLCLAPRGYTPLLDAIGLGVSHLRKTLTLQDSTVVCIITDGEENASKEWTKLRVKALIEELELGAWKFLFLGANFDAYAEAHALGVAAGAAATYDASSAQAVKAMYRGLHVNTAQARGQSAGDPMFMAQASAKAAMNWKVDQVQAMNAPETTTDDDDQKK